MKNCTLIALPNVQSMLCGVSFIRLFSSGYTQLNYTDGSTEGAYLSLPEIAAGRENVFAFVSSVQAQRMGLMDVFKPSKP